MTRGRFLLFIGNAPADIASGVKATGGSYTRKLLESSPDNWFRTVSFIEDPGLVGVVAKLTAHTLELFRSPHYNVPRRALLTALGSVPHIVLIHESLVTGKVEEPDEFDDNDDRFPFYTLPDEVRLELLALLRSYGINVVPYRTNAELSVLAGGFVEDQEQNLLFRMYVPVGRIYAAEADRLLGLFRDWLTSVRRIRVRQDGYTTGSGRVYELFAEDEIGAAELSTYFDDFSRFLELCEGDPEQARKALLGMGIAALAANDIVQRYGTETRRLQVDLKYERESRMLALRHKLESEVVDAIDGVERRAAIERMTEELVPKPSDLTSTLLPMIGSPSSTPDVVNLTVNNPQWFDHVQGSIVQGVQGTVNLGPQAQELLGLVQRFAGEATSALESSVYELEDEQARDSDRLAARQRLKMFLVGAAGKIGDASLQVLRAYVESKVIGQGGSGTG